MKLWLLVVFALASSAAGANVGPKNLINKTFCFKPTSIQVDDSLIKASPQIKASLFEAIFTKLRAYRVPLDGSCSRELYLQIDTAVNGNNLLIYSMELAVYDDGLQPGPVAVWSTGAFGSAVQTGTNVAEVLTRYASAAIDQFAADYATANP